MAGNVPQNVDDIPDDVWLFIMMEVFKQSDPNKIEEMDESKFKKLSIMALKKFHYDCQKGRIV